MKGSSLMLMKEDVAVDDDDCLTYDVDGYDGGYEYRIV